LKISSSLTGSMPADLGLAAQERAGLGPAFDRCGAALYRYIVVRTGGDTHLADDLMQQLWLRATSNGGASVPDDEIEFWLRGIARNLLRAHWRQARHRPAHLAVGDPAAASRLAEQLASEDLPPQILERREIRDQLVLAVTALPSQEQELIIGHYFHGRSLADLAETTGLTARAIEGRLYRARRSLEQRLRELDP
jgi:RNA polymerase sigma factor (sigma-70 family)